MYHLRRRFPKTFAATMIATLASIEHAAAVNTSFLPRPSLRGAILWQRERSAWALALSAAAIAITLIALVAALIAALAYSPFRALALDHWAWGAAAILLVHLLVADLVRIRPQGVTAGRLAFAGWSRQPVPLGGLFRETPSQFPGDPDRPHEPDPWRDEISQWVYYERGDQLLAIDCLRPKAIVDWLNEQLRRVQSLQLPKAHVVEGE